MTVKKLIGQIHLWLGLASGLVVLIVGLTGCCYVFIDEIQAFTAPYQQVAIQNSPVLAPSQIKHLAEKALPGKRARYVSYQPGKAAYVGLFDKGYSLGFYADPYSGKQLHIVNYLNGTDFFSFVLHGHRALWLPYKIGQPIVDAGILIFIILLVTGMVLWWPKNLKKANFDKSFKIKWTAKWKRVNYDLHNVLGFYAMLVLLILAITGSVYGFEWFEKGLYRVTSAGKALPEFKAPLSDTTRARAAAFDSLVLGIRDRDQNAQVSVYFAGNKSDALEVDINHQPGTNYDLEILFFDQYTLASLPGTGTFKKRFSKADFPDQVSRLNYDLHVGQIWGMPTKIIAFGASLICASLPVTGFYIWWGRRKKKPRVRK